MKNKLFATLAAIILAVVALTVIPATGICAADDTLKCDTEHGSNNYYRTFLNEHEKMIYDKLEEMCNSVMYEYNTDLLWNFSGWTEEAEAAWEKCEALYNEYNFDDVDDLFVMYALDHDHPEYLELAGQYISDVEIMRVFAFSDEEYTHVLETVCNREYRASVDEQVDKILARANAYVLPSYGESNYDSEEVYWMVYRVCYEYMRNWVYNDSGSEGCHFADAALLGQPVVCDGIARGLMILLNKCNIPCITVDGPIHEWNLIKIADKWYDVDISSTSRQTTFFEKEPIDIQLWIAHSNTSLISDFESVCPKRETLKHTVFNGLVDTEVPYYTWLVGLENASKMEKSDRESKIVAGYVQRDAEHRGAENFVIDDITFIRLPNAPKAETVSISNASGKTEYNVGETFRLYANTDVNGDAIDWAADSNAVSFEFELGSRYHEYTDVTINKPGTYTISASAVVGTGNDSIEITVIGEAAATEDTIWAGGYKENKYTNLKTSIKATSWKDSKNKSKNGKLVWLVMSEKTDISFNIEKHTVNTKSNATKIASVSKGKVTAKKAGTVYVYAVDTGSMTYEEFVVTIKQTPKKYLFVESAESTAKISKVYVNVGETASVVFKVDAGTDTVSSDCTYNVSADAKYKSNVAATKAINIGAAYEFSVKGLKANGSKVVNSKVTVLNNESNKKASITVVVMDGVKNITGGSCELKAKNDKCKLGINIVSVNNDSITTDKLKVYVTTSEPTINGTKVNASKGNEVAATLSKDCKSIELKAKKDITETEYIYVVATNSVTKTAKAYLVGTIQP